MTSRREQRGLWWIGAVAGLALLALTAAACGSSSKKGSSTSTTAVARTSTSGANSGGYGGSSSGGSSSSGASSGAGQATVDVSSNPKFGKLLVGPNGKTLYLFEADHGTTTACAKDPCKGLWPALAAVGAKPVPGSGVDTSKLSTAMGQVANQVVYNGHLLYYYAGDTKPGQVNGTSIPEWYPVSPSGAKIDAD